GLRRAFVLAGSRSLVTSLWKVSDSKTRELMEQFYANLLGGLGRAEALRQAQTALRTTVRDPRHWAAFICQGAIGPIEPLAARRRLRERVEAFERMLVGAIDGAEVLKLAADLTSELTDTGDVRGAIRLQRRVCDALRGTRGEDDPATIDATGRLA